MHSFLKPFEILFHAGRETLSAATVDLLEERFQATLRDAGIETAEWTAESGWVVKPTGGKEKKMRKAQECWLPRWQQGRGFDTRDRHDAGPFRTSQAAAGYVRRTRRALDRVFHGEAHEWGVTYTRLDHAAEGWYARDIRVYEIR